MNLEESQDNSKSLEQAAAILARIFVTLIDSRDEANSGESSK